MSLSATFGAADHHSWPEVGSVLGPLTKCCPFRASFSGGKTEHRVYHLSVGAQGGFWKKLAPTPLHFLHPLAGQLCGNRRGRHSLCQKVSHPTDLPPWPDPQTSQSAGTETDPPRSSPQPPHSPALPAAVAHSGRLSARDVPADQPSCWATVSLRAAALQQLEHRAPLLQPGLIASVGRPGSSLARVLPQQGAAAVSALPRLRTAPSRSRSVWSAPACWRFRSSALPTGDLTTPPLRLQRRGFA